MDGWMDGWIGSCFGFAFLRHYFDRLDVSPMVTRPHLLSRSLWLDVLSFYWLTELFEFIVSLV